MIQVNDLDYTYPGAHEPALTGLTFEIRDREIVGFLAPSCAGKSSTQKIFFGLFAFGVFE